MSSKLNWRLPPWFKVVFYSFCPDIEQWERERKYRLRTCHVDIGPYPVGRHNYGMCTWFIDADGNKRIIVTVSDEREIEPIKFVATLAHECVHVASAIVEGMSEKNPGEEFQAYVIGALMQELLFDALNSGRVQWLTPT